MSISTYCKRLKIPTEYTDAQLEHLRTYRLTNTEQLPDVLELIHHYNYVPINPKFLARLIRTKKLGHIELLHGPVGIPQDIYCETEPKATLIFIHTNNELLLARFCHSPWFEESVAVAWAELRIKSAKRRYNRNTISWLVNEENLPLQLHLKDLGYIATIEPYLEQLIKFTK